MGTVNTIIHSNADNQADRVDEKRGIFSNYFRHSMFQILGALATFGGALFGIQQMVASKANTNLQVEEVSRNMRIGERLDLLRQAEPYDKIVNILPSIHLHASIGDAIKYAGDRSVEEGPIPDSRNSVAILHRLVFEGKDLNNFQANEIVMQILKLSEAGKIIIKSGQNPTFAKAAAHDVIGSDIDSPLIQIPPSALMALLDDAGMGPTQFENYIIYLNDGINILIDADGRLSLQGNGRAKNKGMDWKERFSQELQNSFFVTGNHLTGSEEITSQRVSAIENILNKK